MKPFFIAALMTLCLSAFAGDKGNGGYSVVCRTEQGDIVSAELLDVFEGREIYKRIYSGNELSVEDLIAQGRSRVSHYASFLTKLDKEIAEINRNIIFISAGNELEPTDDAFPPIRKKGCKFEQVANYQDSGEVLISQEIYDHFDNVSKAALILHEGVYSYRRKALGETISLNSRKLVAQMVAENHDATLVDRWVGDSIYRVGKRPCGLDGTINERIEKCSYIQSPSPYGLVLVTRTKELKEVWLDETNNVLIGDRLSSNLDFESAKKACARTSAEMGHLPGLSWRLPKIEEFQRMSQAYAQVLPNMVGVSSGHWFWTSSIRGKSAFIFNGTDGTISTTLFTGSAFGSVRCFATFN